MNHNKKNWAHWVQQPCGHWDWRVVELLAAGETREDGVVLPVDGELYCFESGMRARLRNYPTFEVLRRDLAIECVRAVAECRGFEVSTLDSQEWRNGRALAKAFTWRGEVHFYDVSMNIVEGEWLQVMTPGAVRYGTLSPIRYRAMELCRGTALNSQGLLVSDAIANNRGMKLDDSAVRRLKHHGIELKGSY